MSNPASAKVPGIVVLVMHLQQQKLMNLAPVEGLHSCVIQQCHFLLNRLFTFKL